MHCRHSYSDLRTKKIEFETSLPGLAAAHSAFATARQRRPGSSRRSVSPRHARIPGDLGVTGCSVVYRLCFKMQGPIGLLGKTLRLTGTYRRSESRLFLNPLY